MESGNVFIEKGRGNFNSFAPVFFKIIIMKTAAYN